MRGEGGIFLLDVEGAVELEVILWGQERELCVAERTHCVIAMLNPCACIIPPGELWLFH